MSAKEKTIFQIIIDEIGTFVITIIMLGLPVLLVIGIYEQWCDDYIFASGFICILDFIVLYVLVDHNK